MTGLRRLIRTTLIGGVIFLLPMVAIVVVVGKAVQIMRTVVAPVSNMMPIETVVGLPVEEILTVLILILCCLVAGMLARSPGGQRLHNKLDAILLQVIPGYAWVKGITGDMRDEEAEELMKPALIRFDDQFQLGFEVDRAADGLVAVYLPSSPDPRTGSVSYVTSDRIQPIEGGFKAVTKVYKNLGRNSTAMMSNRTG